MADVCPPLSEYWIANNSESDPENFSGTDHLKFFPDKRGGRWAALGPMDHTTRDAALEDSVKDLGWPDIVDGSYENCAVRCKAGTAVVMTNNTYHRGSRRRDDPSVWPDKPRVMWRMWAYRTREPEPSPDGPPLAELTQGWADIEQRLGTAVPQEAREVWDYQLAYSLGLPLPAEGGMSVSPPDQEEEDGEEERLEGLEWLLFSGGDPVATEVRRPYR